MPQPVAEGNNQPGPTNIGRQPEISTSMHWRRLEVQNRDHLFNTDEVHRQESFDGRRSQVNFSGRLPNWLWGILAATLGIGKGGRKWRIIISVTLHIITVTSAVLFAVCGLFFTIFDVFSQMTTTTVLVAVCKTIMGAYWVGIGIYAHGLAARLFSNPRLVDCIRMHSKTIFKINTVFIIVVLSVAVVVCQLYNSRNLMSFAVDDQPSNSTKIRNGNCADAKINVLVCQIYYTAGVVYTTFNLLWNLLVASILLSVCRTHTICIRRLMNTLLMDTKIYEEFLMLKAFGPKTPSIMHSINPANDANANGALLESHIWDDDVISMTEDSNVNDPAISLSLMNQIQNNAEIISSMQQSASRHQYFSSLMGSAQRLNHQAYIPPFHSINDPDGSESVTTGHSVELPYLIPQHTVNSDHEQLLENPGSYSYFPFSLGRSNAATVPRRTSRPEQNRGGFRRRPKSESQSVSSRANPKDGKSASVASEADSVTGAERMRATSDDYVYSHDEEDEELERKMALVASGKPPILANENLLFTYFQLVRRLSSTSRLLQRWMMSIIVFILIWCTLIIIYWTSHDARLSGFFEFLAPLVILFLLSSAYAEVNFEGDRLLGCVLPTQERMPVMYYMKTVPLQLKVFSFTLSYNAVLTVVAGVIVTLATRVIVEQI